MNISKEQVLRVLQYKLFNGELNEDEKLQAENDWQIIYKWLSDNESKAKLFISNFLQTFSQVVVMELIEPLKIKLGLAKGEDDGTRVNEAWDKYISQYDKEKTLKFLDKTSGEIARLMSEECKVDPVKDQNEPAKVPAAPPVISDVPKTAEDPIAVTAANPPITPSNTASNWKYTPVPEGPDKHEEFDSRSMDGDDDMKVIGARARGKKHKHEGTNCDDWFEFKTMGSWTFIAVADGAGSKKFSRVGAKAACEAAVKYMEEKLGAYLLKDREVWDNSTFNRNEENVYVEDDLHFVEDVLHDSMEAAYLNVQKAFEERLGKSEYEEILGRKPVIEDFASTLLVAIHVTVGEKSPKNSLVLACQVGDGMSAVVYRNGSVGLMGVADSGEYSGETDFLTSKKKLERKLLRSRTYPAFGQIRALMVMTDGVADDYFPNATEMVRLYGDLVVNGIINIDGLKDSDALSSIKDTKFKDLNNWLACKYTRPEGLMPLNGENKVYIRSFREFAEELNMTMGDVAKSYSLLHIGKYGIPMCGETLPEKKLQVWLDSYQVRGSFDDRTLVVLYREKML